MGDFTHAFETGTWTRRHGDEGRITKTSTRYAAASGRHYVGIVESELVEDGMQTSSSVGTDSDSEAHVENSASPSSKAVRVLANTSWSSAAARFGTRMLDRVNTASSYRDQDAYPNSAESPSTAASSTGDTFGAANVYETPNTALTSPPASAMSVKKGPTPRVFQFGQFKYQSPTTSSPDLKATFERHLPQQLQPGYKNSNDSGGSSGGNNNNNNKSTNTAYDKTEDKNAADRLGGVGYLHDEHLQSPALTLLRQEDARKLQVQRVQATSLFQVAQSPIESPSTANQTQKTSPRLAKVAESNTSQAEIARAASNASDDSAVSSASHGQSVLAANKSYAKQTQSASVSSPLQTTLVHTQQPQSLSTSLRIADRGRSSSLESSRSSDDMSADDYNQLAKDNAQLTKDHNQLRDKYIKVKKYYFEKDDQVKQLQNNLAHLRLASSRTSLDDADYAQRFSRLDGLTAQLAFGIRKSWKTIPSWLADSINKDAISTGKQEMTAAGRAFVSCWLVEELFEKYFHPDLEVNLSINLKTVQRNIRLLAPPPQNSDDDAALSTRVSTWRLATLDGLKDMLQPQQDNIYRTKFINMLKKQLVEALSVHLQDPPMNDLEGGVHMIIELAVSIASHIPLESREVQVDYFMPGESFNNDLMKLESIGIPVLGTSVAEDAAGGKINGKNGLEASADGESRVRMAIGIGAHVRYKTTLFKAPIFGT